MNGRFVGRGDYAATAAACKGHSRWFRTEMHERPGSSNAERHGDFGSVRRARSKAAWAEPSSPLGPCIHYDNSTEVRTGYRGTHSTITTASRPRSAKAASE